MTEKEEARKYLSLFLLIYRGTAAAFRKAR